MKALLSHIALIAFLSIGFPILVVAQTCSCAGAPLLGAQGSTPVFGGDILIGLSYEYHDISKLYTSHGASANQSSERNTQSTLFEAHYGLSSKISLSGTFSYVQKVRTTGLQISGSNESLAISGIGDALLLAKYKVWERKRTPAMQWAVGAGGKIPLGKFDKRNSDNLLLNADMQPGTGAWDGVGWSELTGGFELLVPWNFSLIGSYRHTGSAERFGPDDQYRFGNELMATGGLTIILWNDLAYTGQFQYRSTSSDTRNRRIQPNTGGYWISSINRLSYGFTDRIAAHADFRLPLHQNLTAYSRPPAMPFPFPYS